MLGLFHVVIRTYHLSLERGKQMKPLDSRSFNALMGEIKNGNEAVIDSARILLKGYGKKINCLSKIQYERLRKMLDK